MKKLLNILSVAIMLLILSCKQNSLEQNIVEPKTPERPYRFHVLYPQPTDTVQFNLDYAKHLNLLDTLMGYSEENKPYYITKMDHEVFGAPSSYYQMFIMEFETREALETTINSTEMQEAGKDAMSISSGGAPIVLIGHEK